MLCSNCSATIVPLVVFDLDGTVADYHRQLTQFSYQYWGRADPHSQPWDGRGEFEEYLGLTKAEYREMKLAFRQGGQKRMMSVIPDGIELYFQVRRWRLMGQAEIWFATHRPWMRLDNIDPDTRWWLRHKGFDYDHLLFGDDKYGDLVMQVDRQRIIAVFEDLPKMCDRAEQLGLPVRQVARPHNSYPSQKHATRGTVEQLERWLSQQMIDWCATDRQETT